MVQPPKERILRVYGGLDQRCVLAAIDACNRAKCMFRMLYPVGMRYMMAVDDVQGRTVYMRRRGPRQPLEWTYYPQLFSASLKRTATASAHRWLAMVQTPPRSVTLNKSTRVK